MNVRHINDKKPKKGKRFSWSKAGYQSVLIYRLFRRDHNNRLHMTHIGFATDISISRIRARLNKARRELRDKVDEIDLAAML